jgi:translation initiation factor IF-3
MTQRVNHKILSPVDRILLLQADGTRVGIVSLQDTLRTLHRPLVRRENGKRMSAQETVRVNDDGLCLVQVGTMPCPRGVVLERKGQARAVSALTEIQEDLLRIPVCKWQPVPTPEEEQAATAAAQKEPAEEVRREKEIRLNSTIAAHDLLVRKRKIRELLQKNHPVRLVLKVQREKFTLHQPSAGLQAKALEELIREFTAPPPPAPKAKEADKSESETNGDGTGDAHAGTTNTGEEYLDMRGEDEKQVLESFACGARVASPLKNPYRHTWTVTLAPGPSTAKRS